ncbi:DUF3459 domain-containing protein (plasmid) [Halarchaeum sp. CBA1220]|uniref:alpha-amylase family glycosyl hydrolase n=1 Tax=Halarchaeum sp. CBA1220 TaxID=1853682 RepID=UPI000F3A8074|nr:alpha-amylase family glycosyl hydrolase [Halarchaeum sp. CBA1220]QLC35208.1 DUF3459 domain-containing protein [Halarchaeum sp. CBA1220]
MHHPGPPRFVDVGEAVDLAPRNPDPDATYRWRLRERPSGSDAGVGDAPVVALEPDAPGRYELELDAPDGTHVQTVHAYDVVEEPVTFRVADDDVEADPAGVEFVSVYGTFNDFTMGTLTAERSAADDAWVYETTLQPGTHEALFAVDGEFDAVATDEVVVEGPGRPRVSLDAAVRGEELVVRAAAEAAPDGRDPETVFAFDDRDALSRADASVDGDELRVPLDAIPVHARLHAVPVAERHGVAATLEIERDGEDVALSDPGGAPDWMREATIYEIFVREFAGADLDTTFGAIEERVPYLAHLGVDAVWFTPVCASPTRHGYHITDLFDTADDLGTRAEFESLVEALRDAGIRVLFDLVINHTSRDHPAFHLHRAGVPAYADHYERVPAEQDTTAVDWAGDDAPGHYFNWERIPNLNYDSLAVRAWMLDVVDEWAAVVDGFRCDVAWGVPHGFWKEVRARVKADDAEFLLLDETVPREVDFDEDEFDVHYDTDFYEALRAVGSGEAPADAVLDALDASRRHGFPADAAHMRYVENHDEDRYATACGEAPLRAAVGATFTLPGVPMIYYGQERGVADYRGPMRWYDGDADLTAFHRRLVALRDERDALRAPAAAVERVAHTCESGDADDVTVYAREGDEETLVVALHFGAGEAVVDVERAVDATDLVSGADARAESGLAVDSVAVFAARE